eukprot:2557627-Rhodomonas_salina.1
MPVRVAAHGERERANVWSHSSVFQLRERVDGMMRIAKDERSARNQMLSTAIAVQSVPGKRVFAFDFAVHLPTPYAMSGTHIAYAATRMAWTASRNQVSAYTLPTLCHGLVDRYHIAHAAIRLREARYSDSPVLH